MAKLVLDRVSKQYDGKNFVVENFNLEIDRKEFVIFVGPSGCGKSTVLRMIAGLEEITTGGIYIDERPVSGKMAAGGDIAMVFQNYALYPHMSVYDNIAYSLKIKGVPKREIRERVERVAQILELETVLKKKPSQLSGGQKQRVAMGRAMIRTPKLFLMDEPLSNLDAKLRTQMRKEISKLYRDSSSTFIYVTHDQIEAMTLGTKIVVLNHGQIQQIATPRELYESPVNLFVAGFIGSPQMNFWKVRVEQDRKRVKLIFDDMGEFVLSEPKAQLLRSRGWLGRQIIVGVRPENLRVMKPEEADHKELEEKWLYAVAKVFEMDGAVSYLHLESVHDKITICMKGQKVYDIDQIVSFTFDETKIHFFDPETEEAIR